MSITPLPTSPAAEKPHPYLLAAAELNGFQVNGGSLPDLTDRATVGLLLDQIEGVAALLETAMAVDGSDKDLTLAPMPFQMNAAASGIRTLATLASFANEVADLAQPGAAQ